MKDKYNTVIIGGGPGGYVCAIRLAQLGQKVLIIEKRDTLGGTCLNVGCIPSKVLLDSTEFYSAARYHASDFGIIIQGATYDLVKIMERKSLVVAERCKGLDFLMNKNKITRIQATGKIVSAGKVSAVLSNGDEESYETDNIVLATGSVPVELPFAKVNGKTIISSDDAIALNKVPEHLIIIGAGAIGLELGSVWNRLGARVSIVEMMPQLFGGFDRQMASLLQRNLAGQGMTFYMEHKVLSVEESGGRVILKASDKSGKEIELEGDVLLSAPGRKAYYKGLGLEEAGVKIGSNGKIEINPETYETGIKGIYAVGDIVNGPMLAHKAEEEGAAAAEIIAGQKAHVNYHTIASVVYTSPEFASVGRGEDQLKTEGIEYVTGRFLFKANARANAMNETEGMVKILAEKETKKLLGIHIVGPRASELIAEAAVLMKFNASVDDIIHTVHAHPTLSEVIREAALDTEKRAIHS